MLGRQLGKGMRRSAAIAVCMQLMRGVSVAERERRVADSDRAHGAKGDVVWQGAGGGGDADPIARQREAKVVQRGGGACGAARRRRARALRLSLPPVESAPGGGRGRSDGGREEGPLSANRVRSR